MSDRKTNKKTNFLLKRKKTVTIPRSVQFNDNNNNINIEGSLGKSEITPKSIYGNHKGITTSFSVTPIKTHFFEQDKFLTLYNKNTESPLLKKATNNNKYKVEIFSNLNNKEIASLEGLVQSIMVNTAKGVSKGYRVNLSLVGVGFRASIENNQLVLKIGYCHLIYVPIPEDLVVICTKPTSISILGSDLQQVTQFAWNIRKHRKPEPYKGKGIKLSNEIIRRKESKKK